MASRFHLPLRFSQVFSSLIVLGLSIYVICQKHNSSISGSNQIIFLILIPCLSFVATLYMELVHKFAPDEFPPYIPLLVFSMKAAFSLFYMGGFIALAVSLSKHHVCTGTACIAAQVDVVFAALSYVLWTASATIHGIEISNSERIVELADGMTEKIIEVV